MVQSVAESLLYAGWGKERCCKSRATNVAILGCTGADGRPSRSVPDEKSFHSVANRRAWCTMVPFLKPKRKFRLDRFNRKLNLQVFSLATGVEGTSSYDFRSDISTARSPDAGEWVFT